MASTGAVVTMTVAEVATALAPSAASETAAVRPGWVPPPVGEPTCVAAVMGGIDAPAASGSVPV